MYIIVVVCVCSACVYRVTGSVESLVISSQVEMRGGDGEKVDVLEDDPVIINFTLPSVHNDLVYSIVHESQCDFLAHLNA